MFSKKKFLQGRKSNSKHDKIDLRSIIWFHLSEPKPKTYPELRDWIPMCGGHVCIGPNTSSSQLTNTLQQSASVCTTSAKTLQSYHMSIREKGEKKAWKVKNAARRTENQNKLFTFSVFHHEAEKHQRSFSVVRCLTRRMYIWSHLLQRNTQGETQEGKKGSKSNC